MRVPVYDVLYMFDCMFVCVFVTCGWKRDRAIVPILY